MSEDPAVAVVRKPNWMQMADAIREVRRRLTELFPGGLAGAAVKEDGNETIVIQFTSGYSLERHRIFIADLRDCGFELAS